MLRALVALQRMNGGEAATLPVSEIFRTIQGEATWTGTPAVFIRLQGCDVGCPWCDTRYSWELDPAKEIDAVELVKKEAGDASGTYCHLTAGDIAALVRTFGIRHVVITGGEPCLHDIHALTERLINDLGSFVQVETSGTREVTVHPKTWVTLSPKIGMPGGYDVQPQAVERADEIKMPVGKMADIEALQALLERGRVRDGIDVWVQPLSLSHKATALCVENATLNGWRISVQVHAVAGWR